MVLVYRLHGFVVVVDSIAGMLLVLREKWVDREAQMLSFLWQFLLLVDHKVEEVYRLDGVIVVWKIPI